MLHSVLDGIVRVGDPTALFYLVVATLIGVVFGVLPGLSGLTALALLLPLIYGMEPGAGLAFLLAAHAVVNTGGSVTAILLGIPGAPANTATLIDGFPMAKQGRGGEALGAALAASGIGGVIGVIFLIALLPILQPIVLLFGSPETFCLVIMGITFIAGLGHQNLAMGLVSAGFGMYLGFFGYQQVSGVPRYWLDYDYLLNGFRLIPLALGLFAIPELVSLARTGGTIAPEEAREGMTRADVLRGFKTAIDRRWLVLRSSVIGVVIGIIPGIGGETAPWVAYASAKQTSPESARFGEGAIDGVIAPESANNSKEGGALVPTLAFGIPGSSGNGAAARRLLSGRARARPGIPQEAHGHRHQPGAHRRAGQHPGGRGPARDRASAGGDHQGARPPARPVSVDPVDRGHLFGRQQHHRRDVHVWLRRPRRGAAGNRLQPAGAAAWLRPGAARRDLLAHLAQRARLVLPLAAHLPDHPRPHRARPAVAGD